MDEEEFDEGQEVWDAIWELRGSPDEDPVIPLGLPGAGKRRSELTAREAKRLAKDEEVLDFYIAEFDYLDRKALSKRLGCWPRWPDGRTVREALELVMDDELKQLSRRVKALGADAYNGAWMRATDRLEGLVALPDMTAAGAPSLSDQSTAVLLEALRTEWRRLLAH